MKADDKVNILMVDDQPAKLLSYEVILAELGENLIKATTASEALSILLKTDVAVVLMDVSMPDLDGFELADVIRQHPRFQKTAIIFISGVHFTRLGQDPGIPQRRGRLYLRAGGAGSAARQDRCVRRSASQDAPAGNAEQRAGAPRGRAYRGTAPARGTIPHPRRTAGTCHGSHHGPRSSMATLQYWNTGAENLYGWKREEVMGRTFTPCCRPSFPFREKTSKPRFARTRPGRATWCNAPRMVPR